MTPVTIVIPNYNGIRFIKDCLDSLKEQTFTDYDIIVVDNASKDGSPELVEEDYPYIKLIKNDENYGFARAVNQGIQNTDSDYVILLNNDTVTDPFFVQELYSSIKDRDDVFSCQAKMLKLYERDRIDSAGDLYCALGWAFSLGKDEKADRYVRTERIFSSCAGAAIYRREIFEKIGYFDERHGSYLEDVDIGYRANISGYKNLFVPEAKVFHAGSGSSGSRHNSFKVRLASRNSVFVIHKNMPSLQIILNLPFLMVGYMIKILFFFLKGMGKEYLSGVFKGLKMSFGMKKYPFGRENVINYLWIQLALWKNMIRRITG
ncbi:MAG: glycosyltransferase family 2 protein [Lachnospiraceae bacterium]|nr:glycosyltransferase family 2 protein [Lachnospiraceae bacterium]